LAIQQSNYWPSFEDDERKKEEDTVGGVFPIQVQIEDEAGFGENKQKKRNELDRLEKVQRGNGWENYPGFPNVVQLCWIRLVHAT
jgi:hypothetical protein